jgi:hypothetical protein
MIGFPACRAQAAAAAGVAAAAAVAANISHEHTFPAVVEAKQQYWQQQQWFHGSTQLRRLAAAGM